MSPYCPRKPTIAAIETYNLSRAPMKYLLQSINILFLERSDFPNILSQATFFFISSHKFLLLQDHMFVQKFFFK